MIALKKSRSAFSLVELVVVVVILGIIAAMVLFALGMPLVWGERRYWAVALFAIGFPAVVYSVFAIGLDVYFAPGVAGMIAPGLF